MKKLIISMLLVSLTSLAIEPFMEKADAKPLEASEPMPERPKTGQEAIELKERLKESSEALAKAQSRLTKDKNTLQTDGDNLTSVEKQALESQISKNQKFVDRYMTVDQMVKRSQGLINKYNQELQTNRTEAVSSAASKPLNETLGIVNESYSGIDTSPNAYRNYVSALEQGVENFTRGLPDVATIKSGVKGLDVQGKLDSFNNYRKRLIDSQSVITGELDRVNGLLEKGTATTTDTLQSYKKVLENAQITLQEKGEQVDSESLNLDLEQVGLLTKAVNRVSDWFSRAFDFFRPTATKRSVNDEITTLQQLQVQAEKNVKPIARFMTDANHLITNANNLANNRIQGGIRDGGSYFVKNEKSVKQMESKAEEYIKQLDAMEQVVQKNQEKFDQAYSDAQQLTADFSAKIKRYKGDFDTLFESNLDYYKSNSIFGGTRFKPNEAYQALGLEPGATPAQIDAAYLQKRTTLKEGSPDWVAARNASYLLRNPVSKATYDAFLRDWEGFESRNFDPTALSKTAKDYLNSSGQLSKLEITKKMFDQINETWENLLLPTMARLGGKRFDVGKEGEALSAQIVVTRNNLNSALKALDNATKAGAPGMPLL